MSQTKYSASRVGSFESCKLKYSLNYMRGYYAEESQQSVVTRKGNAFHAFTENYDPKWTHEEAMAYRDELTAKWNLPEEYSLEKPVARWLTFYKTFLASLIETGTKLHREIQFDFELEGNRFTGKLDVLLEYPDGSFHIVDYKTGKSTNTSYYVDQMLLYTWALHKQYGIPEAELVNKVKINIFFGFADPDKEDPMKIFKAIKFTKENLDINKNHYTGLIKEIESKTWEPEPTMSKMCEFCSFCGFKSLCPATAKAGLFPLRGTQIKQRDWAVQQGIK
jgi:CRISPR/Cas system-associated exonuclease Cas4 (RecB family)